jgi:recombination protein RecA
MASKTKDSISSVLANIEKAMGNKGRPVFSRFKDIDSENVPVISFGIPAVDKASYCGGVPRGKMVELFGPESSGKSLLSLHLTASAQNSGLECALIDVEQSFDPDWAAQHGVNVDNLVYANEFTCGENALEYAYQLCKSGAFGLVIVDSTAALVPKAELEGTLEDNARVGAQAQMMSRGCRKIVGAIGKTGTTCVFINQLREKIGVMWGNPETTPGGRALKFYSHQRIRVQKIKRKTAKEDGEDVVVGQTSTVTFVKNKVARPFGKCEFDIIFDPELLNPVVMLCNEARGLKLIKPYKQVFRLYGMEEKAIETGATKLVDVARYLVQHDLVVKMLDKVIEERDNDPLIDTPLDEAILEMKEDPSKIVAPSGGIQINTQKLEDATEEEVKQDIEDQDKEPTEV